MKLLPKLWGDWNAGTGVDPFQQQAFQLGSGFFDIALVEKCVHGISRELMPRLYRMDFLEIQLLLNRLRLGNRGHGGLLR